MCINFGPVLRGVGGWKARAWVGGVRREEAKSSLVKTQPHWSPPDGPDYPRDMCTVPGRISGWLLPIGMLHKCQCVGHGFTR